MRDKRDWAGVLRGPWLPARAILWGVALTAIMVGAAVAASRLLRLLGMPKDGPLACVALLIVVAAVVGAYSAAVRLGERRSAEELAPRLALPELVAGLAFGIVLISIVIGVLVVTGADSVAAPAAGAPWRALQIGFGAGFIEELVFRGVLMRLLWEAFGVRVAVVVSATLFGLAHLLNPHPDIGALYIIPEAGLMLAALYVLTGRLWASIGTHAGWNFAQVMSGAPRFPAPTPAGTCFW